LRAQIVLGEAEIRRITRDLRPANLDELGLAPALGRLSNEFSRDHSIRVSLDADDVSTQRLSPRLETAIFRIVQESLNNVARHSGASQVAVAVKQRGVRVELSVSDNGRGLPESFEQSSDRSGYGLLSMSERAALLDGEFRIRPGKPQGTTIEVTIPLA
jgi:two-component system, NarL family, sensor kinase